MGKHLLKRVLIVWAMVFLVSCGSEPEALSSVDGQDSVLAEKGPESSGEAFSSEEGDSSSAWEAPVPEEKVPVGKKRIRIKAVGDIMSHDLQSIYASKLGTKEKPDYRKQFALVRDFLRDADLTIGNFEATSNDKKPISGYPRFNTKSTIFSALADTGFDVLTTANNHALDGGLEGVVTTLQGIEGAGLHAVGSHRPGEDRTLIQDVGGMKIGILSYSLNFNGIEESLSREKLASYLNPLDEKMIREDLLSLKEKTDFIIVYPHWGVEYAAKERQEERELARKMVDWGADLIVGNHPHVVQSGERILSKDGRWGAVAYACGNFISLQRLETLKDIRTEQSLALEIEVEKEAKATKAVIAGIRLHPLWVRAERDKLGYFVQTLRCSDYLPGGAQEAVLKEGEKKRVQQAYEMTMKTAGGLQRELLLDREPSQTSESSPPAGS